MKEFIIYSICLTIVNIIGGYIIGINNNTDRKAVEVFEKYYESTEKFLDSLNDEYDWVDAFDPEEYLNAKEEIEKLYN